MCLLRGTDWIFIYDSTFCPHSVFMCFVWIWEQTAIPYTTLTESECVYCAVRTGSLYIIQFNFRVWRFKQTATICPTQYAHHNMPNTICPSQYAHHNMPITICPTQYAHHNMPITICPTQYAHHTGYLNTKRHFLSYIQHAYCKCGKADFASSHHIDWNRQKINIVGASFILALVNVCWQN